MSPTSDASEDRIAAAVARALELKDEGAHDWLERAVEGSPELEDEVQRAVAGSGQVADVLFTARDEDPLLGRTLADRFRLRRRAGAGAMGAVYEAEDVELARTVAVKVVRSGFVAATTARKRFAREAEAMAAVRSGAVCTIHDRGETPEGDPFLVMEWIDGRTLDETIEKAAAMQRGGARDTIDWLDGEFGIDRSGESSWIRLATRWVHELSLGLHEVHRAGVLHRDIKPTNVMVRKDGSAALLDFGLALLDDASKLTRGPSSIGTPAYMPPESLNSDAKHTVAGDVYSLGATLYHALTLEAPYNGTPAEIIAQVSTREPVPAVRRRPGLPRDLQAILDKVLQRKPSARYASAAAFAADLGAYLAHEPVSVRPIPTWRRVVRRARRSWFVRGAAAAIVVILGGWIAVAAADHYGSIRRTESDAIQRHLPPNMTTVGEANRFVADERDRSAFLAQLDRLVELGTYPIRARLQRAAFRLDHGDAAGARADMRALAREAGTEFTEEIAARYARLADGASSHAELDLEGLPEAVSPADRMVAAHLALRSGDLASAHTLLDPPAAREDAFACAMWIVSWPIVGPTAREAREQRWEALEAARDMERTFGKTAMSRHLVASFSHQVGRFTMGSMAAEEGVALCPRAHTVRINAASNALSLGDVDRAHAHLRVAHELRPHYAKPVLVRTWAFVDEGAYDEARAWLARLEEPGSFPRGWLLARAAYVETYRALDLTRAGDSMASRTAVEEAMRLQREAEELGWSLEDTPTEFLLEALGRNDVRSAVPALAGALGDEPLHTWRMKRLLDHLPNDLNVEETAAIRVVLDSLRSTLDQDPIAPADGSDD